jgi:hypothetical protein
MSFHEELEKLKAGVIQQRDELKVKASLAKMEVRDEWEKVEEKVDHLMAKLETLGDAASDASGDVVQSAKHLGEEIKAAYERIKTQL